MAFFWHLSKLKLADYLNAGRFSFPLTACHPSTVSLSRTLKSIPLAVASGGRGITERFSGVRGGVA